MNNSGIQFMQTYKAGDLPELFLLPNISAGPGVQFIVMVIPQYPAIGSNSTTVSVTIPGKRFLIFVIILILLQQIIPLKLKYQS